MFNHITLFSITLLYSLRSFYCLIQIKNNFHNLIENLSQICNILLKLSGICKKQGERTPVAL